MVSINQGGTVGDSITRTDSKNNDVVWEVRKKNGRLFLSFLLISIIVSAVSVFLYDKYYVPKIVAIDIKTYITEQRDLFLSGKITEDGLKENIDKLERVVENVPKNKIILMGDAVIRNIEVIKP